MLSLRTRGAAVTYAGVPYKSQIPEADTYVGVVVGSSLADIHNKYLWSVASRQDNAPKRGITASHVEAEVDHWRPLLVLTSFL